MHDAPYDPQKAHEYYMRIRKLKGRQKGAQQPPPAQPQGRRPKGVLSPREKQKVELKQNIQTLGLKLHNLEQLIQKKEAILKQDQAQAKSKANKNSKAKGDKPVDKAKARSDAKKYRQSHKQSLKNKAKQSRSKGGGQSHKDHKPKPDSKKSIADLKALATKVKGQLAIAKQKLAAL